MAGPIKIAIFQVVTGTRIFQRRLAIQSLHPLGQLKGLNPKITGGIFRIVNISIDVNLNAANRID